MPYEIFRTTAENVVEATDAAFQRPEGVDKELVSVFLDTTPGYAEDALKMASELGLIREEHQGVFVPGSKCGRYLCSSLREHKTAVLRFVLENYAPYRTFKARLELDVAVGEAANKTRALHSLGAHRDVIVTTLCDLGIYSQSLISEGGGLYRARDDHNEGFLQIVDKVIQDRENAMLWARRRLGEETANWVDVDSVLEDLVTAYQKAAEADDDPRAPIVYAGNAVESFLSQLGAHHNVSMQNCFGINAKTEALSQVGQLSKKHKFMLKYLGHVRNAADHGVDADINASWDISPTTAVEYVHVSHSMIRNLVCSLNGKYII